MIPNKLPGKDNHYPSKSWLPQRIQNLMSGHRVTSTVKPEVELGQMQPPEVPLVPTPPDIPARKITNAKEIKSNTNIIDTIVSVVRGWARSINNFIAPYNKDNIEIKVNQLVEKNNQAVDALVAAHNEFVNASQGTDSLALKNAATQLKQAGQNYDNSSKDLNYILNGINPEHRFVADLQIKRDPMIDYDLLLYSVPSLTKVTMPLKKSVSEKLQELPPPNKPKDLPPQFLKIVDSMRIPVLKVANRTDDEQLVVEYQTYLTKLIEAKLQPFNEIIFTAFSEHPLDVHEIMLSLIQVTDLYIPKDLPHRDDMIEYVTAAALRQIHEGFGLTPTETG